MHRDFYVYILFRPNGIPCYVGKGRGQRWYVHERSKYGYKNPRLARIIEKANGELPKIKVREGLLEADAFETEKALITAIGRSSRGPLVNMTDGGDGTSGLEISAERRAAISAVHKGKAISAAQKARQAEASAARVWRPESIAKISAGNRGKVRTPEMVAVMRTNAKAQMARPEMKEAIAAANRRRIWTPEARQARSETSKEVWRKRRSK